MSRARTGSSRSHAKSEGAKTESYSRAPKDGSGERDSNEAPRWSTRFRKIATSLSLIVFIAFVLRLGFAWDYARQNSHQALAVVPFLQEAGNIAISLATGHGFSSPFRVDTGPTAWMTPVYPWILSELFRIFGVRTYDSFVAAAVFNIICSALTCIPIFLAGKRVAGIGAAAGAAWLWAIFPNTILNTFQSMWDASLGALLAATILWATLALGRSERRRDWCAYGFLWGLGLLTTATLIALLPLLLGWLVYERSRSRGTVEIQRWRLKSAFAQPALTALFALLCCVPWAVRNYEIFHRFVPLRSNLGLQLWLGNNENAEESWREQLHPIFNSAERARYVALGEIDYMQEKKSEAVAYMFSHPGRTARLAASRFVATWSGGTPHPLADFLHTPNLWFRGVLLFNICIALGAAAGILVLVKKRSAYALPIAAFPVILPWAYYLTLAYPRYRLPVDPAVLLLTAVALQTLFSARAPSAASSSHR
ncbi:MAG: glycosyltransferase family 39 protein [Candidatus Acidiferrales bacterium]